MARNLPDRLLGGIILIGVVLRLAVALYLGDVVDAPPLLTDQRSYHALGVSLISGRGFSFEENWYPFTLAHTPTAHWSFLYSLYIAAIYAVTGPHPLAARLVGAVLGGILLPWMAFRFTKVLFAQQEVIPARLRRYATSIPLIAATLTAFYAYFILYAATLMTETFYIVALLWSLERGIALAREPTRRNALWLGLAWGIATLIRQSILPWIAVMCVWLLWTAHRRGHMAAMARSIAGAVLVIALLIAPFTIRNYRAYGSFLLLNSNAGYAMYSAQHPLHGTTFQPFAAAPLPDDIELGNEAKLDRELMKRGIQFVIQDPIRYLRLSLSRMVAYFEFWPSRQSSLLHNIGRVGSYGLFLPFMVYGLWLSLDAARQSQGLCDWMGTPTGLTVVFMVFYSVLHIFTWAMPRYRLPVDATALPFAALALIDVTHRLQLTRWLPWCEG
ncbi:MAG: hypothetical protein Kow0047_27280 [Anaerolineae bacterium]